MSVEVTRILEFDAGHRISKHGGKCAHVHGHRYKVEITCVADLDDLGMVIDFGLIKALVGNWIDENLDHAFIAFCRDTEICDFLTYTKQRVFIMGGEPTAENLSRVVFDVSKRLLVPYGVVVKRVRLWETPNCYADVVAE
jgi:6-pyruvoyltetrahydropterin/6-carboxytetrahydropterin synthase